jgi:hypothetical protein
MLSRRHADGSTERDHLLAVQRAGEIVPELDVPPIPYGCEWLWAAFLQLNASRGSNGMGPSAIGPADLLAWQQLRGLRLNHWEIDTLLALDGVALRASEAAQRANETTNTAPPRAAEGME